MIPTLSLANWPKNNIINWISDQLPSQQANDLTCVKLGPNVTYKAHKITEYFISITIFYKIMFMIPPLPKKEKNSTFNKTGKKSKLKQTKLTVNKLQI